MLEINKTIFSRVVFDNSKKYRYILERVWDKNLPKIIFIGFNPSNANEISNDNTVDKCIHISKNDPNCGGIFFMNIFPHISSKLKKEVFNNLNEDILNENKEYIKKYLSRDDILKIVICWGNGWAHRPSDRLNIFYNDILNLLYGYQKEIYCFGINQKTGTPKHPARIKVEGLIKWR